MSACLDIISAPLYFWEVRGTFRHKGRNEGAIATSCVALGYGEEKSRGKIILLPSSSPAPEYTVMHLRNVRIQNMCEKTRQPGKGLRGLCNGRKDPSGKFGIAFFPEVQCTLAFAASMCQIRGHSASVHSQLALHTALDGGASRQHAKFASNRSDGLGGNGPGKHSDRRSQLTFTIYC